MQSLAKNYNVLFMVAIRGVSIRKIGSMERHDAFLLAPKLNMHVGIYQIPVCTVEYKPVGLCGKLILLGLVKSDSRFKSLLPLRVSNMFSTYVRCDILHIFHVICTF